MSGQSEGAACAKVVAIDGPQGTGKTLVTDRIIRTAGAYFRYLSFTELNLTALSLLHRACCALGLAHGTMCYRCRAVVVAVDQQQLLRVLYTR
jgi:cytidylate kinase